MQISRGQFLEGFPLSRSVGVGNDPYVVSNGEVIEKTYENMNDDEFSIQK